MTYHIFLFGPYAQRLGKADISVHTEHFHSSTVGEILGLVGQQYPVLRQMLHGTRLAVNHAYVPDTQRIEPGDELALIGMVSGG